MIETTQRTTAHSWTWFVQAITGIALVILLSLHMIAQHFIVEGGLREYADIVAYLRNPVILVLESLFLITVTVHALLGVRAVAFDFGLTEKSERVVSRILAWVGVATLGYGAWIIWLVAG